MPKKKRDEPSIDIESADAPSLGVDASDDEFEDEAGALSRLKKLKVELAKCKAERQEYLDGWQRLRADVANAKKAEAERAARGRALAKEDLIAELLPVLDSFDMARSGDSWNKVDEGWRKGIEHILSQLEAIVVSAGATRFGKAGETFDPYIHEAVREVEPETEASEGKIVAILRSGWKMGEQVLRPAQVTVAHKTLGGNQ